VRSSASFSSFTFTSSDAGGSTLTGGCKDGEEGGAFSTLTGDEDGAFSILMGVGADGEQVGEEAMLTTTSTTKATSVLAD